MKKQLEILTLRTILCSEIIFRFLHLLYSAPCMKQSQYDVTHLKEKGRSKVDGENEI